MIVSFSIDDLKQSIPGVAKKSQACSASPVGMTGPRPMAVKLRTKLLGDMPDRNLYVVMFSKEQVRQRKLAHFLKKFGPAALPTGPALADMMGTFQFLVDGWNDDPNELYAIPEIRRFYQHFHEVWPYWFFFCDLETETLQMMTLCLLPNLTGIKHLGAHPLHRKKLRAPQQHDGTSWHERAGHLPPHPGCVPLLQPALRCAAARGFREK
ncbi:MAG: hypothetical protein EAZ81_04095 [Verrucomicrobia bacterium]|nr:MAG: hypothetical protein EAZ81_04095 [Verrucomicrobiota bacterium]